MVRITFFRSGGVITGFESEGHSGYAESGSDIVCAGVSAVLLAAAQGLARVAQAEPSVQVDERRGYLRVELRGDLPEANARDAQVVLRTAEAGVKGIEEEYPRFVRVTGRNRR